MTAYKQVGARLCERGYAALPIIPGTKRPGYWDRKWIGMSDWRDKYTRRMPMPMEINAWSNSDAGVGVVTGPASSGLVGIDIDTDDGDILSAILSALPTTTIIKRGAKGATYFYRGNQIRGDNGTLSPSWNGPTGRICDFIGPGRQTVLPPTIHPDTGQPYTWTGGEALEDVSPDELPELPPDVFKRITDALSPFGVQRVGEARATLAASNDDEDEKPHRRLNNAALANLDKWVPKLNLYRCKRLRAGEFKAVATWRPSNTGNPPEKRKLNLSISAKGISDFGAGPKNYTPINLVMEATNCSRQEAFNWLMDQIDPEPVEWNEFKFSPPKAKTKSKLPDIENLTCECEGVLKEIIDWVCSVSPYPSRTLALGTALTVIGTLIGRDIAGPTKSAAHLYVLLLGPTGSGKDTPLKAAKELLRAATGSEDHIGPGRFMSATSVLSHLQKKPLALASIDEFGSFLMKINSVRASSHEAEIKYILNELWSNNYDIYISAEWAQKDAVTIHSPALSILGATTQYDFFKSIAGIDTLNGFVNRFMFLVIEDYPDAHDPADLHSPPEELVNKLRLIYSGRHHPTDIVQRSNPDAKLTPNVVGWASDQAKELFNGFRDECRKLVKDDPQFNQAFVRAAETAVRIATIHAAGRWNGAQGFTVDAKDMAWGIAVSRASFGSMITSVKDLLPEDAMRHNQGFKRIRKIVQDSGTITRGELSRKINGALDRDTINKIIDELKESGEIVEGKPIGDGPKKARVYHWAD